MKLVPVDYNPFAESQPSAAPNEDLPFYQALPRAMGTGFNKAAAGVAELGLNLAGAFGADVAQEKKNIANWQRDFEEQGRNTGITGVIGEALGNPLTYIPAAKGVSIPMQAGAQSLLQGVSRGTGDEKSTIQDQLQQGLVDAPIGAITGKVLGTIAKPELTAASDEVARAAALLKSEGIDVSKAAFTGSKSRRALENAFAELPSTANKEAALQDVRQVKFNQALLKRAGINAKVATPEVLSDLMAKKSEQLKSLTAQTQVRMDDILLNKLNEIESMTARIGQDAGTPVRSFINDLKSAYTIQAKNPNATVKLKGKAYQDTRSRISQLAQRSSDPMVAGLLRETRNALDEAAERSIAASGNKTLLGKWQQFRTQYEAAKVIDKAMKSTGYETLKGNISPTQVLMAARNHPQYTRGGGAVNDLARAGALLLRDPVSNSGTAQRSMMMKMLTGGGEAAAGGGIAGALTGFDPLSMAVGAGAGLAVPKAAQAAYYAEVNPQIVGGLTGAAANVSGQYQNEIDRQNEMLMNPQANEPSQPQYNLKPVDFNPFEQSSASPQGNAGNDMLQESSQSSNADYLSQVSRAESSGNVNARNPNSSASGEYQFIDSTWNSMVDKYGADYGITKDMKNNPQAQRIMAQLLTQENSAALKRQLGREPTEGELYLAHFAGSGGARKILANPNDSGAKMLPRAAKANRSIFYDEKGRQRSGMEIASLLATKVRN